jgi:DNA-dependent RNA polymerase
MGRRFDRRHKLKLPSQRRGKHYSATPTGRVTIKTFTKPLAEHLTTVLDKAPGHLAPVLRQVPPEELAQTALLPLLHSLAIGWQDSSRDWRRETAERVGRNLHDLLTLKALLKQGVRVTDMKSLKRLRSKPGDPARNRGRKPKSDYRDLTNDGWDARDRCQAGDWLVLQAMKMPYLTSNRSRWPYMPDIAPGWVGVMASIRRKFIEADKDQLPDLQPPPDWAGMQNGRVSFVSGNHPECRKALTTAFEQNDATFLEHVAGVSALQRVPLKINKFVLKLVEEFAVKLLDREHVDPIKGDDEKTERKRSGIKRRNWAIVNEDLEFAKVVMGRGTFHNKHHCDWRGRVMPVPFLHHQRADHVRALFLFAEDGHKLGGSRAGHFGGFSDLEMLKIHVANCNGEKDKDPWEDRLKWVDENLENGIIDRIATKPRKNSDLWAGPGVDSPFSYVAACKELIDALDNPDHETHLPIFFDATASGLQHFALLSRDPVAARLVNLCDDPRRYDIYGMVANDAIATLKAGNFKSKRERKRAAWWCQVLEDWTPRDRRKLVKQAVMIFPYGSSPHGMMGDIGDGFREICHRRGVSDEHMPGTLKFLAEVIVESIGRVLPGAAHSRKYLFDLAAHSVSNGQFVKWRSPSGFPIIAAYYKPNVVTLRLGRGQEMKVTIGDKPTVDTKTAITSVAPNFVHSLDAAHLMRCVLSANRAGITNLLTVHDCWGCLAPDAADMHRIFRNELYMVYNYTNWMQNLALNNDFSTPMLFGGYDMEQLPRCNYGAS